MDNLLQIQDLNPSQQAAVTYNEGPQLVIAGAGSGKTRVLTYKIAYLLASGVKASNILALTFTNKAAREMQERIQKLVPASMSRYLWMGTFHSICYRILRHECERLGFTRDFSIYDTSDQKSLLKQIIKEQMLDDKIYKPAVIHSRISAAKNRLITPEAYAMNADYRKQDNQERLYEMSHLYELYQARLRAANAMDFDDLLVNLCKLLQEYPDVKTYYQNIFQYVLVDEYQDTNYAQYLIVKQLAEPQNKICVVGDDAQSIYSFRGADIRNILSFQKGYPNARLFKLERNYRSTQTIVRAANSLIKHNANQIYKEVYSENAEGARLRLTGYLSDREEAQGVVQGISLYLRRTLSDGRRATADDVAVLYRTNAQSRALENELRHFDIPYRIYGGTSFYQRKEIKDAVSYFRLTANPYDNEALIRVINYPARGIGDTTVKRLSLCATERAVSMFEVAANPDGFGLPAAPATKRKLESFAAMIQRFQELIETQDAYFFAETVMRESGIMTAAALDTTQEGIDRKLNLEELLSGIHDFVDRRMQEGISFTPVQDFLGEISLLTDQDENLQDHTPRVTLLTVHAAKGLEFPIVYIVGLEENLFPSQFCKSNAEMEEERRLLYVAITRAMEVCNLTYARQRFKNGAINFSSPSRFLNDLDRNCLQLTQPGETETRSSGPRYTGIPVSRDPETRFAAPPRPGNLTRVTPDKASTPASAAYAPGTRVRHRVFGDGTVQRVYRENDNDKIDILFDKNGKKTLLLTYAKLEKI